MYSICPVTGTLTDLGSQPVGMTQIFIYEGSETLLVLLLVAATFNSQFSQGMDILRAGQVNPLASWPLGSKHPPSWC